MDPDTLQQGRRAVLLDQGAGQGNRPRPVDDPRAGAAAPWNTAPHEPHRRGHAGRALVAGGRSGLDEAVLEELPRQRSQDPENLAVLVVDDDALISMSMAAIIEDLGHLPFEANSGEEAIRVLKSDAKVDLLITDFSMPKMNGLELARRAASIRPGLPILLATGYAELPPAAPSTFLVSGSPSARSSFRVRFPS